MSDGEEWSPAIVMVAPNGARRTKTDHPGIPLTPEEIARDAAACREAGAAMIHLHVRDAAGAHTLDAEAYRTAIAAIRRAVGDGLIVQMTTEAVGRYPPDEQMAAVRAVKPEAVSLSIAELIPDQAHEPAAAEFLAWLGRERIAAQYILYSADDVRRFADLCRRGIVPDARPFVLYVLGRYAKDRRSAPADLVPFLAAAEGQRWPWAMCAFGPKEGACALAATALGGHPRVGFENNLYLSDGEVADGNAALVAQVAEGARRIGRPLADAAAGRRMLSL